MGARTYRERLYQDYARNFRDPKIVFDFRASALLGKAYDYYFRGWLPRSKQSPVLDVGCGDGKQLFFLTQRGFTNVTGVDGSAAQVAAARKVVPTVIEENAMDFLEGQNSAFELLLALDVIEHLTKPEALRFLDGCFKALKPGGRLIVQTPNGETPWGAVLRYSDFTHEVCFGPTSLCQVLRVCGFVAPMVRELGPVPWGCSATSTVRYLLWQALRLGLNAWNLAETGTAGQGVWTRVFLASAVRPQSPC